jgi:CRISPR-associated protein (TIGR03984 family)
VTAALSRKTAAGALTDFARVGGEIVGFLYSPVDAPWFRVDDGAPVGGDGERVDLTGVFELRAFDGTRELRWWNVSGSEGNQFVLDHDALPTGWRPGGTYERILWGAVRTGGPEWTELFAARIGPLHLPVGGSPAVHSTIRLGVQEYLVDDEHGNVSVVDERLVGLTVSEPTKKGTAS